MQLSESVYNKLAMQAAKALVEKDVPLNETLDKLAAEHDMNVEQLKRLCEATNNVTFNEAFAARGKQGSDDRLVEFKVASASEILRGRVGAEKTASVRTVHAPDFDAAWESRPLSFTEAGFRKEARVVHINAPQDPAHLQAKLQERGPAGTFGHPFLASHEDAVDYTPMAPGAAQAWLAQNKDLPGNYPSEPSEEDFHKYRKILGMPAATYPHGPALKTAHAGDPFLDVPTKPASPLAMRAAYEHLRVEKIAEARRLADAANGVAACFRGMYEQDKFASFEKEAMTLHGALANEVLDHVRHTLDLPEVTRDFGKTAGLVVLNDKTQAHTLLKIAVQARGRLMVIHEALKQAGAL